ncbi:MAG: UbiA-like polyprenyltransferase [Thermoanaerobaculia bacterium]
MEGTSERVAPRGPIREALELVKFPHTVFALPFALLSAFRAASGVLSARALLGILGAMVGARTAAMCFNRIVDRSIDARNPRTASRALPAGRLTVSFAAGLCAAALALFFFSAYELNALAFRLAFPAAGLLFLYSYTKRFTSGSHLVLGLCLGIAPLGAWIAVRGRLDPAPAALAAAVVLWTAGFDVLYSLQDEAFDRSAGLRSIPALLGARKALWLSAAFHAATLVFLGVFAAAVSGGMVFWTGIAAAAAALAYQHAIVKPGDLSKLDAAFFTANGFLSLAVGLAGIADLWFPVHW